MSGETCSTLSLSRVFNRATTAEQKRGGGVCERKVSQIMAIELIRNGSRIAGKWELFLIFMGR